MSEFKSNRTLPVVDLSDQHFWCGGADGKLHISQCAACGYYIHPAGPICPECLGRDISPVAMSGKATVETFTVNYQAWFPDLEVPYVVAIVALDEQPSVRLMTNIIDCDVEAVHIGMRVEVSFKQAEDIYLPLFRPEQAEAEVAE